MENKDIKQNIAKNITELRKANKLTQLELAEKLNYSDKAISRWERGDTLPDIDVLCKICELFNVNFEYLIEKSIDPIPKQKSTLSRTQVGNRLTITLLVISIVWFVATFIYVYGDIINNMKYWQVFIWAIPTSAIIASGFNYIWGKKKYTAYINSVFIWTLLAAIYIQSLQYNLWLIFLLGAPLQIIIFLWARLKPKK